MPLIIQSLQAPGRIEVPVYFEGIVPLNLASLEDPFPSKAPKWNEGSTSPAGLAGNPSLLSLALGGSTATHSQPSSATSSLTSLLLEASEFQLSSRQSSASDLGARPFLHSRLGSTDGSLSARSDRSREDAVDAIATFDNVKCLALAKVKVQPSPALLPSTSSSTQKSEEDVVNSPNRMVAVYQNLSRNTSDQEETGVPGLTVRPTRVHTNTLPHNPTCNPYDLGALLADFKRKKSPSAGAAPPAPRFPRARVVNRSFSCNGPAVVKESPFVATAATASAKPNALAASPVARSQSQKHSTEGLVMIPGMKRLNTT